MLTLIYIASKIENPVVKSQTAFPGHYHAVVLRLHPAYHVYWCHLDLLVCLPFPCNVFSSLRQNNCHSPLQLSSSEDF